MAIWLHQTGSQEMPHLIDIIDAVIFLSPLVILAAMAARFTFARFAH
jgi:hypothetical protein